MTTYWQSTPKYWCKACGKWVHDNLAMRTHHEKSLKHQENTKELIAKAQSSFSEKKAEEENLAKELARIERQAYNAYLKYDADGAQGEAVPVPPAQPNDSKDTGKEVITPVPEVGGESGKLNRKQRRAAMSSNASPLETTTPQAATSPLDADASAKPATDAAEGRASVSLQDFLRRRSEAKAPKKVEEKKAPHLQPADRQAAPAFGEVGFKSAWSKPVFTKVVEAPKDDDSDPEAPATRIIGVNVDPVRDDDPPLALPKRVAHTAPASGEASTTPTPLAVKKRKADENDDEEGGLVIEETLKGDAPAVSFKKRKGAAFRKKPGP
ncbi:Zinc finger protein ZOP1 [Diplonema papillatum]|nr:Zinc finger protein ZOP1 [Diplonema papillatum]